MTVSYTHLFAEWKKETTTAQIDGLRIMCTDIICDLLDHGPVGTAFVPGKLLVGKQCLSLIHISPLF